MPTRKQRRRLQKERRHEYETVWVDGEGNELEDPPEDAGVTTEKRANGKSPAKAQPQRGGRTGRVPPAPSWQRAARRSLILGAVIFAVFYIANTKNGSHNVASALGLAAIYTVLFIPFSYTIDRFSYNRWQRRTEQQADKRQQAKAKKR